MCGSVWSSTWWIMDVRVVLREEEVGPYVCTKPSDRVG